MRPHRPQQGHYEKQNRRWGRQLRLAAAEQELAQWCQQRAIIDNRIVELQATIQALTPVVQRSEQTINLSVPQLCLKILSLSAAFHSPTQIRDGLTNWGIQINSPNPMAVIHTALGRLVQSGYVEAKSAGGPPHFRITAKGTKALQGWCPRGQPQKGEPMYVMNTNGCFQLVPAPTQFQPYGLREFLQDISLALGIMLAIRALID